MLFPQFNPPRPKARSVSFKKKIHFASRRVFDFAISCVQSAFKVLKVSSSHTSKTAAHQSVKINVISHRFDEIIAKI